MSIEQIRELIDELRKRQTEKAWTFKNWNDFRKHFYAQLFIILFKAIWK